MRRSLSIVARFEKGDNCLYNRSVGDLQFGDGEIVGKWEYDMEPVDIAVERTIGDGYMQQTCHGPSIVIFFVSVRFPRSDYRTVLKRFKEFNRCGGHRPSNGCVKSVKYAMR